MLVKSSGVVGWPVSALHDRQVVEPLASALPRFPTTSARIGRCRRRLPQFAISQPAVDDESVVSGEAVDEQAANASIVEGLHEARPDIDEATLQLRVRGFRQVPTSVCI